MRIIGPAAALILAALTIAGCGSPAAPAAVTTHSPAARTSSAPAPPAPAPPSKPVPPSKPALSMNQAKAVYVKLVDPMNRDINTMTNDWSDSASVSQYHADVTALTVAVGALIHQLGLYRWPAKVQPYVTSMAQTSLVAEMRCGQETVIGHTYSAMQAIIDASQDCSEDNNQDAATIRTILGLPDLAN